MASTKLLYVNQPGSMLKIFEKVRHAQTPDRFTADFLKTKLGFRGGNYRQFIPLAKRLGLLGSDGVPTELYKRFRNLGDSGAAMAQALKNGYREIFERNEYADNLTKEQIRGLVVEITGLDSKNRIVRLVCQTFESLKTLANFDASGASQDQRHGDVAGKEEPDGGPGSKAVLGSTRQEFDLNLAYTINLVLPRSDDPAVFNAIFKALRENLLRR